MKILIVGAGIGGLALAKFLEKEKNFDVTVIEQAPEWKTIGFVLALWPCGYKMTEKLGIKKQIDKNSLKVNEIAIHDKEGNFLDTMDLSKIEGKYGPVCEVERDKLHKILRNLNKKTKILMGTKIKSIDNSQSSARVTFSNGKTESFDLVVGADGIDSQTRKFINSKEKEYTGFRYWFVWMKKKHLKLPKGAQLYAGNGKAVTFFPSKSKERIAAWFTMPRSKHPTRNPKEAAKILREQYKDFKGPVKKLMKNLTEKQGWIFGHDDNEVYLKKWFENRIVLIGDAAHATSPILGLGASMALEDSYVLSKELSKVKHNPQKIKTALKKYHKKRYKRISRLPGASKITHIFFGISKPFNKIKNIIFKRGFSSFYLAWIERILKKTPK